MKSKKLILEVILTVVNFFVCLLPIQEDKITIVSLEGTELKDDLLIVREELPEEYKVTEVLYHFRRNDLKSACGYMFNTIRQLWHINRSKLVLINDNNFVVSRFKRSGVIVVQVWHASGAIKKFGNCLERQYQIANYDYVLANSDYWKGPYSQAFGVDEEQVIVTGLPKLDCLQAKESVQEDKEWFYKAYPQCEGKKLVLYTPTFRGNIYKGIRLADIDVDKLMDGLGSDYVLLYKLHPLLAGKKLSGRKDVINVTEQELYDLFGISDIMISDYSSVIFDYTMTGKPLMLFASDINEYDADVGFFMQYISLPGTFNETEQELVENIRKELEIEDTQSIADKGEIYIYHKDGENTRRVLDLITSIMKN